MVGPAKDKYQELTYQFNLLARTVNKSEAISIFAHTP